MPFPPASFTMAAPKAGSMGDLPINLAVRSNAAACSAGGVRAVGETAAELAAAGVPCVVGVVVETNGSTYRKRGALILLDATVMRAGALSGGCLESDCLLY